MCSASGASAAHRNRPGARSMLKLRILTAAILLPAVVALVWFAPTWALGLAAGAVALTAAWEWTALSMLRAPWLQALCTLLLAVLLICFWALQHDDWGR